MPLLIVKRLLALAGLDHAAVAMLLCTSLLWQACSDDCPTGTRLSDGLCHKGDDDAADGGEAETYVAREPAPAWTSNGGGLMQAESFNLHVSLSPTQPVGAAETDGFQLTLDPATSAITAPASAAL